MLLPTIINSYLKIGQPRVKSLSQIFVDTTFFLALANIKSLQHSLQHISSSCLSFTFLFNSYDLGCELSMSTLRYMLNLKKIKQHQHSTLCSAIFLTHQKKMFSIWTTSKIGQRNVQNSSGVATLLSSKI